jgi:ABC transporter substrate binding protein (PQQ-dependent alcohol dehydrogenase system)
MTSDRAHWLAGDGRLGAQCEVFDASRVGRWAGALAWALLGELLCRQAWTEPAPGQQASPPVAIVYLSRDDADTARATLMDPVIADYGWQGAKFGVDENNLNGRFVGKRYELVKITVAARGDLVGAAKAALSAGHLLIVADLQAADLLAVADLPEAKDAVILDARSSDDALRQRDCRNNVFHVLPNWAMRADALGQFLARKNWRRWFLLRGVTRADEAYAAAVKRAASRVGAKIVTDGSFEYQADSARAAGGQEQIQTQLSVVTHTATAYDVVFVADTGDAFGDYLLFNTWDPRPVVGTHGLVAVAWHHLFKEYAARGMQYRFYLAASRDMTERDYGNWLAASIFGEAVTRGGKTDAAGIRSYLLSDQFSVPALKGEGLSFRRWDHQLRQPIPLFGPQALVAMWPQGGTGRPKLQTDDLGFDQAETACHMVQ